MKSENEIKELIELGETHNVEFKSKFVTDKVGQAICALANDWPQVGNSYLFIGVDDKTSKVIGITEDDNNPVYLKQREILFRRLSNIYLAYLYVRPFFRKATLEHKNHVIHQTVNEDLSQLKKISQQQNFFLLAVILSRGESYITNLEYCKSNNIDCLDLSDDIFKKGYLLPK